MGSGRQDKHYVFFRLDGDVQEFFGFLAAQAARTRHSAAACARRLGRGHHVVRHAVLHHGDDKLELVVFRHRGNLPFHVDLGAHPAAVCLAVCRRADAGKRYGECNPLTRPGKAKRQRQVRQQRRHQSTRHKAEHNVLLRLVQPKVIHHLGAGGAVPQHHQLHGHVPRPAKVHYAVALAAVHDGHHAAHG